MKTKVHPVRSENSSKGMKTKVHPVRSKHSIKVMKTKVHLVRSKNSTNVMKTKVHLVRSEYVMKTKVHPVRIKNSIKVMKTRVHLASQMYHCILYRVIINVMFLLTISNAKRQLDLSFLVRPVADGSHPSLYTCFIGKIDQFLIRQLYSCRHAT